MKWHITISVCCVLLGNSLLGQQPYFSQGQLNPAYTNAALTAYGHQVFTSAQYRTLWTALEEAPQTISASAQFRMGDHAAGITILHDQFGLQSGNDLLAQYAFRFNVLSGSVSAGAQIAINSDQYDLTDAAPHDLNDPLLSENVSTMQFNAGLGAAWENEKGYAGVSVPYLFASDAPFGSGEPVSPQINFIGAYRIELNPMWDITPSVWYGFIEGQPSMMHVQAHLRWYELIQLDLGFRNNYTYTTGMRVYVQEKWSIGYNYERNTAFSSAGSANGHEVAITYSLPFKDTTTR